MTRRTGMGYAHGYAPSSAGISVAGGNPASLVAALSGRHGGFIGTGFRWHDEALCAEVDPELFFPGKGGSVAAPKVICRRCPVRAECLADALRNWGWDARATGQHGVWGGTSPEERQELRDRFGSDVTAAAEYALSQDEPQEAAA